ncbi:MAG: isopentenyl-diphosphate Delta-isomerase [Bacteroidota bacterium]|jgi:isopentenyl-diphosphate delta-isomerase|nr:isopentenyl-diphosphate Delta-isomerase [Bacteroidota bacterium]
MQEVILVDENDFEIGTEEKLKAHLEGKLHRAFSIFVINSNNELLLQKRASQKYHSPGLWTNTCCSHPAPGEALKDAVQKRLQEEMGFNCQLNWSFSFIYKATFENGLTEYEFDHVYLGKHNLQPRPNPAEVEDWKWMDIDQLRLDIKENNHLYTFWFTYIYERFYEKIKELSSYIG